MNILILNPRDIKNPRAGGAEVHLHEIFTRIAQNHQVTLLSSRFPNSMHIENLDGITVIRKGNEYTFNLVAFWNYLLVLRNKEFDIVVDDISKLPFYTPLYVKRPVLTIVHHLWQEMAFREVLAPLAVLIWSCLKLIPVFYKKTVFVAVSESTKEELIDMGILESKIKIVHNAIDHNLFAPGLKSAKPEVVYFGRVKRYKQVDHLIQAFKIVRDSIPEARLTVAGKGDDYVRLERLVKEYHLESTAELVGEVSEAEKLRILQRAWVIVIPSMKEGWGISVIEANACATPAIAYNVPGLKDSIRDGETGLLVRSEDIGGLAEAIITVLSDSELRQRLGLNAQNWASTFNWDKSADEFERVMEHVVHEKHPRSNRIQVIKDE